MAERADVVIIGGGVMGVSIAHHLAAAGTGRVILLEKRFIGAGSSGKSGAIIRQHYSTRLLVEMARHGVLTFRDFFAHASSESGWEKAGCLVITSERDRAAAEGNVALMEAAGAQAELIAPGAPQILHDCVNLSADEVAAWEPEAGYVDPALVLAGYAGSAARRGVEVRTNCEALDIEVDRGRVRAVTAAAGRIECDTAVLCAGPWAKRMAARAGLELPLTVIRPQLAFFRRPADFPAESHPVIADLPNGFYCRPDPGDRTLVGALDTSKDWTVPDPDHYVETASTEFCGWARERVVRRMGDMERSFGRGGYCGLYTLTPDSHPIIGAAPGMAGLYLAVGFSGHGFKLSPAVGRALAELVVHGTYRTLDLSPLRATRFAEGQPIRSAYEYGLLS